ncbi:MAG: hypothetical protein KDJ78_13680, partial [Rhodobacteraceae bacterium]|nr:hypothetical protein [Paracoccaceae bacterium]
QVYARPGPPGARVFVPGPLDVLEGLTGPRPEPVAGGNRRIRPPAAAEGDYISQRDPVMPSSARA